MTFDYVRPESTREVFALLAQYGSEAKLLAGGVNLGPLLRRRLVKPRLVVSLRHLDELRGLSHAAAGGLVIGALATLGELEASSLAAQFGALMDALRDAGSVQIRNQASIGGNLCQADPFGDIAPALIALGAVVGISNQSAKRSLPAEGFFTGWNANALGAGELLSDIRIGAPSGVSGSAYSKFSIRHTADRALAGVAVWLRMDREVCADARIAVAGGGEIPVRIPKAEQILAGRQLGEAVVLEAARAAATETSPPSDFDATGEYRRDLIRVLCARATQKALARAVPAPQQAR